MLNPTHTQIRETEALGVSVAMCCHNSEKRLPEAMAYLKRQRVSTKIKWEVVVVDNASADGTAATARQCWGDGPAPIHVVREPLLGLCFARQRAFEQAQYEIVSFIDDDNWISADWITTVSECMTADPDLGALASCNAAVADVALPEWFSRYSAYYAAWNYPESATIATWFLTGAGMAVRKSVWEWLMLNGFTPRLSGRLGNRLSSSEDVELGCAIRLAGWNVRVEPRLQLKHYMPSQRLEWRYLRRLLRRVGESHVVLDAYWLVRQSDESGPLNRLRQTWWVRLAKETFELLYHYPTVKLVKAFFREMEGDDDVSEIELRTGRLLGLARLRSRYRRYRHDVAHALWRRAPID